MNIDSIYERMYFLFFFPFLACLLSFPKLKRNFEWHDKEQIQTQQPARGIANNPWRIGDGHCDEQIPMRIVVSVLAEAPRTTQHMNWRSWSVNKRCSHSMLGSICNAYMCVSIQQTCSILYALVLLRKSCAIVLVFGIRTASSDNSNSNNNDNGMRSR